jgi:hypothetical protein
MSGPFGALAVPSRYSGMSSLKLSLMISRMSFEAGASERPVGEIKLLHDDWYLRGASNEGPYSRRESEKGLKWTSTHSLGPHIRFRIECQ